MPKKCLVFGSFDGLHNGHIFLLNWAQQYADAVYVALASDQTIRTLKQREPIGTFNERKGKLIESGCVHQVTESAINDNYACIRHIQPDLIVLGYDQSLLHDHLINWIKEHKLSIDIVRAPAYKPNLYKTSLLYDRLKADS